MKLKILLFFSFMLLDGISEITVKTEHDWYDTVCSILKVVFCIGGISGLIFYSKNEKFRADIERLIEELDRKIAQAESPLKNISFNKK